MKQHKKLLINLVFAAIILAAAAVLLLVRKANQTGAPLCAELIYGDSNTRLTFSLEKDADYDVDTGYLTVHIKIQDGAARFVDSPCPDHICESFGWLSEEDQTATCLPARAVGVRRCMKMRWPLFCQRITRWQNIRSAVSRNWQRSRLSRFWNPPTTMCAARSAPSGSSRTSGSRRRMTMPSLPWFGKGLA